MPRFVFMSYAIADNQQVIPVSLEPSLAIGSKKEKRLPVNAINIVAIAAEYLCSCTNDKGRDEIIFVVLSIDKAVQLKTIVAIAGPHPCNRRVRDEVDLTCFYIITVLGM